MDSEFTHAPMIGSRASDGPGGNKCVCCNVAPGKARRANRRMLRRQGRQQFRAGLKRGDYVR